MSAAGLVTAQQPFSGLRPIKLRRDLGPVADLIEYCFAGTLDAAGRAAIREMRVLSRSGPLLWALGGLSRAVPGLMQGYVWLEQDRLVGNVSLSPTGYDRGLIIANVAVHPDFRRRGIARRLMHAAMDVVERQRTFAILQVDADNYGARTLYEDLGFVEQRTFVRWRRPTHHQPPPVSPDVVTVRRMTARDARPVYELAHLLRPNERGGLGWLRPTDRRALRPPAGGPLRRLFSARRLDYWVVDGAHDLLDAALVVESRAGCSTALFDVLVHPDRQGTLEAPLIAEVIRRVSRQHRPLVVDHPADDEAATAALRQHYFRPERTLVHMIWDPAR